MSRSAKRAISLALLAMGAALAAYAVSDHPLYGGEPGFGRTQALIAALGAGLMLCALLPARIGGRVVLLAASSLVMLLFAEFAGELALGSRLRPVYQADDTLIFKLIPDRRSAMTLSARNGGATVAHRINRHGFRGGELKPAGSSPRVVVYGDSFSHAAYTPEAETLAARLAVLLKGAGEVEVVNAGVSSYGPDQVSLKMEAELPALRPDAVVVAIFAGNDYGDLMRNKLFRLDDDGRLAKNAWRLDPKVRGLFDLSQKESILKRAVLQALATLRARAAGQGAIDLGFLLAQAEREYRECVLERNGVVTNTHMDYYSADVSLQPASPSAQYKVRLMRAVMQRIRDIAAANRVPLTFLLIPHPVDVVADYDGWRIDRARYPAYAPRNQIQPLEDAARALGVPFVSLYDAFRTVDAGALYFRDGDDHWNSAGQRRAAELLARQLVSTRFGQDASRGGAASR